MTNCVVMPTCKRPEMLALALEALSQTKNCPDDIRIFADTSAFIDEIEYVRDEYCPHAMIFHAKPHVDVPSGMWNILNAIKQGSQAADDVFLIEEDVIVFPDFFDWHTSQDSGYFAQCGRRMRHLPNYEGYTNPGSMLRKSTLKQIIPHINEEMFADRRVYFDKHFGQMDEVSDLDDGLIRRIQKLTRGTCKFPDKPKCAHIGFRAYNHYREWVNEGPIRDRILNLRGMLLTTDYRNKYTGDFEVPYPQSN